MSQKGKKSAAAVSTDAVKKILSTDPILSAKGLSNYFYAIDPEFAMWYDSKAKLSGDLVRHILTGSTNDYTQYPNFNQKPACLPFPYEYRNSQGRCVEGTKVPLWAMVLADDETKKKFPQWGQSKVIEQLKIKKEDILKHMIINMAFKGGEDIALLYILFKQNPDVFRYGGSVQRPVADTRYTQRA